jgi:hypothetical protein
MKIRSGWLAWTLCGLMMCLAVVMFGIDLRSQVGSKPGVQIASAALLSLAMVVFAIVAALIVARYPRNTIGWLLMVPVGMVLVVGPLQEYLERLAPSAPTSTLPLLLLVWFSGWSWLLLIFPLLHIPLLFPNGQPPTPRWRWVRVAAIGWTGLFVLIATFAQSINANTTPNLVLDNPIGVLGEETVQLLVNVWLAGMLVLIVLCVAALFIRYRRANETERKQIKWLLYACALFLVMFVSGTVSGLPDSTGFAGFAWQMCFNLSLAALPAAIGIAILKYRLYDIDVIIRRTLIYSVLTALLALVYLGSIVVLQALLRPVVGTETELATVVSTLTIAALFHPLRRRIQNGIDRRFYRRKYDAAKTLDAFSARLRDETDLNQLSEDMLHVVQETLQPAHINLWLHDGSLQAVEQPSEAR